MRDNITVAQRFISYTKFDTQSAEEVDSVPSTPGQMVFAQHLKSELEHEGLVDVVLDDKGFVYATLPANDPRNSNIPTIGFIAHYDTSPDCSGRGVKARVVEGYDGGDIPLNDDITLSPKMFPELLAHVGEDLIVTDGHTLLGADDKAGVAEIVQAMAWLRDHPETVHGKVRIAFTPDEETGRGAEHFDVEAFGCQWAYTMDGGDIGELEYENFNAAVAKVVIRGISVHPGYAKGKMVNASVLATEFIAGLPATERPENTEGYEGFFHVMAMKGSTAEARMTIIIRDHDRQIFECRKQHIKDIVSQMNNKYGEGTVAAELKDQYYNMKEIVSQQPHVIDIAIQAMREAGVTPRVQPIRGGTDGSQLSFRGLPCPNIFAGGLNFHGPYEFVSVQSMEKAVEVIVRICSNAALRP